MGTAKLSREVAEQIRQRAAKGERQCDLAAQYGVTSPTINAIVHGRLYPAQPLPAKPRPDPRAPYRGRLLDVIRGSARSSGLVAREIAERSALALPTAKAYLRDLRKAGLVERLGSRAETRYRILLPPSAPVAPRGDRPRRLGFRSHLHRLREQASAGEIA